MHTPGNEPAHVAGFCLAEGIYTSTFELLSLAASRPTALAVELAD
jgi:formate dehydrogenase assembly factor FdhD